MSKVYVATVMNRHYISENAFIFSVSHTVLGTLDEKNNIFKDRNGNEYLSIVDDTLMMSEVPYGVTNLIPIENLKETLGQDMPLHEAIKEYERQCKNRFYYVSKLNDGKIFYMSFNQDMIKQDMEARITEENTSSDKVTKSQSSASKFLKEDFPMDPELASLIIQIADGAYSREELKEIRENLLEEANDIDQTIKYVDEKLTSDSKKGSNLTSKAKKSKININDVFNKVTKTLIAQDMPARRVIAEITRKELYPSKKQDAIILTGATGVGKTKLMELIAKYIDKPFIKVDSTQLTIAGYKGKDIEEVLWELYEKCGRDKEKAENAIIFFDEIDKKGSPKKEDPSGQGVLNSLLTFIQGEEYTATPSVKDGTEQVKINTSNMTIILGGAFSDVYGDLNEKQKAGFISKKEESKIKPTTEDFVEKAMMPGEFMGRTLVVRMNDLDVEAIKRIMLESDESAIRIQQEIFQMLGTKITFTNEYIDAIAEDAVKKKTGARGINAAIDESTWCAFDEVSCNEGVYSEVIIGEETVKDPTKYQLIKRKVRNGKIQCQ